MENAVKKLDLTGLNIIFWGFILTLLDFYIFGFDILPDFIGYILIIVGIIKLIPLSINFKRAKPFAIVSLILSFFEIYQLIFDDNLIYRYIFGITSCVINILLYYYIINGITDLAKSFNNTYLINKSNTVFISLLIIHIANTIGTFTLIGLLFAMFILDVITLVINILFLIYIKKSYNQLNGMEFVIEDALLIDNN